MKKIISLFMSCCLLLSFSCAHAITMEEMVLLELPKLLKQSLDGFSLSCDDGSEEKKLIMQNAADGKPALFLDVSDGQDSKTIGVGLETIIEALFCCAAGVDELPEGAAADMTFVADIAGSLYQTVLSAVEVQEQSALQPNGKILRGIEAFFFPKKAIAGIDAVIREKLTEYTVPIDDFLNRYSEIIRSFVPGVDIQNASDLMDLWNELNASSLLPMEIPVELHIETAGALNAPWNVEAEMAGLKFSAEYSGTYLIAQFDAWSGNYVFDSRDFSKLWRIVSDAWNHLSASAFSFSVSQNEMRLKFDISRLAREMQTELAVSMQRYERYTQLLLKRYMSWLVPGETDVHELRRFALDALGKCCRWLDEIGLPSVEVHAKTGSGSVALEISLGGVTARAHFGPSNGSLSIPGFLTASGSWSENTIALEGILDDYTYSLVGVRESGQWMTKFYEDEECVADILVNDTSIRIIDGEYEDLLFALAWNENSVQLDIPGESCFSLNAGENSVSWQLSDGVDTYSGQLSWGGLISVEYEMHKKKYDYYYGEVYYQGGQFRASLSPDSFEMECIVYRPYSGWETSTEFDFSFNRTIPSLRANFRDVVRHPRFSEMPQRISSNYALDYEPGRLGVAIGSDAWVISSSTPKTGNVDLVQLIWMHNERTEGCLYIDSALSPGVWTAHITGDNEYEIRFAATSAQGADEEVVNAKMLNVSELLQFAGLNTPGE